MKLVRRSHIKPYYQKDGVTLYQGDFRDIIPRLAPVDLIYFDPPWAPDCIDLYDQFAQIGMRVLKNGAFIMVFMMPQKLLLILEWFRREGYIYYTTFAAVHPGQTDFRVFVKRILNYWTAIAVFQYRNQAKPPRWLGDGILMQKDRARHPWGHSFLPAETWIPRLTEPGQVILDPSMGGGTSILVAKSLGRQAIGIDLDQDACDAVIKQLKGIPVYKRPKGLLS